MQSEEPEKFPGREIIREVLDRDLKKKPPKRMIEKIMRKVRRKLASLKRGLRGEDDLIASALGTLLRRQDPDAKLKKGVKKDPQITEESEVWELLEKHFLRKVNNERKQVRYPREKGVREADLSDPADRDFWLSAFTDGGNSRVDGGSGRVDRDSLDDADMLESCVADLLATMRELLSEGGHSIADDDPFATEIVQLWLQSHTQREIAEHLDIKHNRVRRVQDRVKKQLRGKLDTEGRDGA